MPTSSGAVRAGRAYVEISADNAKFNRVMRETEATFRNFGSQMTQMSGQLLAGVTAASAPFALSAKLFSEFDESMRTVAATTRNLYGDLNKNSVRTAEIFLRTNRNLETFNKAVAESQDRMRRLTQTARQLGRDTSFTAKEAADTMVVLARAGFNVAEINAATKHTLNLARATGIDAAESAQIVIGVLRAFRMEAAETQRVVDLLGATANASPQNMSDLGNAMRYVGSVAKQLNVSLQTTLEDLGTLAKFNIRGEQAGTALRNMYLRLTSVKNQNKLKGAFGVDVIDESTGDFRRFSDILTDIQQKVKDTGMASSQVAANFKDIFGMRSAPAALAMMTADIGEMRDALADVNGFVHATADEINSGLNGAIRLLISKFQDLQIAVVGAFSGPLGDFLNLVGDITARFAKFLESNKEFVATIAKVAVYGGSALVVFGGMSLAIGVAVKSASSLLGIIRKMEQSSFGALSNALNSIFGRRRKAIDPFEIDTKNVDRAREATRYLDENLASLHKTVVKSIDRFNRLATAFDRIACKAPVLRKATGDIAYDFKDVAIGAKLVGDGFEKSNRTLNTFRARINALGGNLLTFRGRFTILSTVLAGFNADVDDVVNRFLRLNTRVLVLNDNLHAEQRALKVLYESFTIFGQTVSSINTAISALNYGTKKTVRLFERMNAMAINANKSLASLSTFLYNFDVGAANAKMETFADLIASVGASFGYMSKQSKIFNSAMEAIGNMSEYSIAKLEVLSSVIRRVFEQLRNANGTPIGDIFDKAAELEKKRIETLLRRSGQRKSRKAGGAQNTGSTKTSPRQPSINYGAMTVDELRDEMERVAAAFEELQNRVGNHAQSLIQRIRLLRSAIQSFLRVYSQLNRYARQLVTYVKDINSQIVAFGNTLDVTPQHVARFKNAIAYVVEQIKQVSRAAETVEGALRRTSASIGNFKTSAARREARPLATTLDNTAEAADKIVSLEPQLNDAVRRIGATFAESATAAKDFAAAMQTIASSARALPRAVSALGRYQNAGPRSEFYTPGVVFNAGKGKASSGKSGRPSVSKGTRISAYDEEIDEMLKNRNLASYARRNFMFVQSGKDKQGKLYGAFDKNDAIYSTDAEQQAFDQAQKDLKDFEDKRNDIANAIKNNPDLAYRVAAMRGAITERSAARAELFRANQNVVERQSELAAFNEADKSRTQLQVVRQAAIAREIEKAQRVVDANLREQAKVESTISQLNALYRSSSSDSDKRIISQRIQELQASETSIAANINAAKQRIVDYTSLGKAVERGTIFGQASGANPVSFGYDAKGSYKDARNASVLSGGAISMPFKRPQPTPLAAPSSSSSTASTGTIALSGNEYFEAFVRLNNNLRQAAGFFTSPFASNPAFAGYAHRASRESIIAGQQLRQLHSTGTIDKNVWETLNQTSLFDTLNQAFPGLRILGGKNATVKNAAALQLLPSLSGSQAISELQKEIARSKNNPTKTAALQNAITTISNLGGAWNQGTFRVNTKSGKVYALDPMMVYEREIAKRSQELAVYQNKYSKNLSQEVQALFNARRNALIDSIDALRTRINDQKGRLRAQRDAARRLERRSMADWTNNPFGGGKDIETLQLNAGQISSGNESVSRRLRNGELLNGFSVIDESQRIRKERMLATPWTRADELAMLGSRKADIDKQLKSFGSRVLSQTEKDEVAKLLKNRSEVEKQISAAQRSTNFDYGVFRKSASGTKFNSADLGNAVNYYQQKDIERLVALRKAQQRAISSLEGLGDERSTSALRGIQEDYKATGARIEKIQKTSPESYQPLSKQERTDFYNMRLRAYDPNGYLPELLRRRQELKKGAQGSTSRELQNVEASIKFLRSGPVSPGALMLSDNGMFVKEDAYAKEWAQKLLARRKQLKMFADDPRNKQYFRGSKEGYRLQNDLNVEYARLKSLAKGVVANPSLLRVTDLSGVSANSRFDSILQNSGRLAENSDLFKGFAPYEKERRGEIYATNQEIPAKANQLNRAKQVEQIIQGRVKSADAAYKTAKADYDAFNKKYSASLNRYAVARNARAAAANEKRKKDAAVASTQGALAPETQKRDRAAMEYAKNALEERKVDQQIASLSAVLQRQQDQLVRIDARKRQLIADRDAAYQNYQQAMLAKGVSPRQAQADWDKAEKDLKLFTPILDKREKELKKSKAKVNKGLKTLSGEKSKRSRQRNIWQSIFKGRQAKITNLTAQLQTEQVEAQNAAQAEQAAQTALDAAGRSVKYYEGKRKQDKSAKVDSTFEALEREKGKLQNATKLRQRFVSQLSDAINRNVGSDRNLKIAEEARKAVAQMSKIEQEQVSFVPGKGLVSKATGATLDTTKFGDATYRGQFFLSEDKYAENRQSQSKSDYLQYLDDVIKRRRDQVEKARRSPWARAGRVRRFVSAAEKQITRLEAMRSQKEIVPAGYGDWTISDRTRERMEKSLSRSPASELKATSKLSTQLTDLFYNPAIQGEVQDTVRANIRSSRAKLAKIPVQDRRYYQVVPFNRNRSVDDVGKLRNVFGKSLSDVSDKDRLAFASRKRREALINLLRQIEEASKNAYINESVDNERKMKLEKIHTRAIRKMDELKGVMSPEDIMNYRLDGKLARRSLYLSDPVKYAKFAKRRPTASEAVKRSRNVGRPTPLGDTVLTKEAQEKLWRSLLSKNNVATTFDEAFANPQTRDYQRSPQFTREDVAERRKMLENELQKALETRSLTGAEVKRLSEIFRKNRAALSKMASVRGLNPRQMYDFFTDVGKQEKMLADLQRGVEERQRNLRVAQNRMYLPQEMRGIFAPSGATGMNTFEKIAFHQSNIDFYRKDMRREMGMTKNPFMKLAIWTDSSLQIRKEKKEIESSKKEIAKYIKEQEAKFVKRRLGGLIKTKDKTAVKALFDANRVKALENARIANKAASESKTELTASYAERDQIKKEQEQLTAVMQSEGERFKGNEGEINDLLRKQRAGNLTKAEQDRLNQLLKENRDIGRDNEGRKRRQNELNKSSRKNQQRVKQAEDAHAQRMGEVESARKEFDQARQLSEYYDSPERNRRHARKRGYIAIRRSGAELFKSIVDSLGPLTKPIKGFASAIKATSGVIRHATSGSYLLGGALRGAATGIRGLAFGVRSLGAFAKNVGSMLKTQLMMSAVMAIVGGITTVWSKARRSEVESKEAGAATAKELRDTITGKLEEKNKEEETREEKIKSIKNIKDKNNLTVEEVAEINNLNQDLSNNGSNRRIEIGKRIDGNGREISYVKNQEDIPLIEAENKNQARERRRNEIVDQLRSMKLSSGFWEREMNFFTSVFSNDSVSAEMAEKYNEHSKTINDLLTELSKVGGFKSEKEKELVLKNLLSDDVEYELSFMADDETRKGLANTFSANVRKGIQNVADASNYEAATSVENIDVEAIKTNVKSANEEYTKLANDNKASSEEVQDAFNDYLATMKSGLIKIREGYAKCTNKAQASDLERQLVQDMEYAMANYEGYLVTLNDKLKSAIPKRMDELTVHDIMSDANNAIAAIEEMRGAKRQSIESKYDLTAQKEAARIRQYFNKDGNLHTFETIRAEAKDVILSIDKSVEGWENKRKVVKEHYNSIWAEMQNLGWKPAFNTQEEWEKSIQEENNKKRDAEIAKVDKEFNNSIKIAIENAIRDVSLKANTSLGTAYGGAYEQNLNRQIQNENQQVALRESYSLKTAAETGELKAKVESLRKDASKDNKAEIEKLKAEIAKIEKANEDSYKKELEALKRNQSKRKISLTEDINAFYAQKEYGQNQFVLKYDTAFEKDELNKLDEIIDALKSRGEKEAAGQAEYFKRVAANYFTYRKQMESANQRYNQAQFKYSLSSWGKNEGLSIASEIEKQIIQLAKDFKDLEIAGKATGEDRAAYDRRLAELKSQQNFYKNTRGFGAKDFTNPYKEIEDEAIANYDKDIREALVANDIGTEFASIDEDGFIAPITSEDEYFKNKGYEKVETSNEDTEKSKEEDEDYKAAKREAEIKALFGDSYLGDSYEQSNEELARFNSIKNFNGVEESDMNDFVRWNSEEERKQTYADISKVLNGENGEEAKKLLQQELGASRTEIQPIRDKLRNFVQKEIYPEYQKELDDTKQTIEDYEAYEEKYNKASFFDQEKMKPKLEMKKIEADAAQARRNQIFKDIKYRSSSAAIDGNEAILWNSTKNNYDKNEFAKNLRLAKDYAKDIDSIDSSFERFGELTGNDESILDAIQAVGKAGGIKGIDNKIYDLWNKDNRTDEENQELERLTSARSSLNSYKRKLRNYYVKKDYEEDQKLDLSDEEIAKKVDQDVANLRRYRSVNREQVRESGLANYVEEKELKRKQKKLGKNQYIDEEGNIATLTKEEQEKIAKANRIIQMGYANRDAEIGSKYLEYNKEQLDSRAEMYNALTTQPAMNALDLRIAGVEAMGGTGNKMFDNAVSLQASQLKFQRSQLEMGQYETRLSAIDAEVEQARSLWQNAVAGGASEQVQTKMFKQYSQLLNEQQQLRQGVMGSFKEMAGARNEFMRAANATERASAGSFKAAEVSRNGADWARENAIKQVNLLKQIAANTLNDGSII